MIYPRATNFSDKERPPSHNTGIIRPTILEPPRTQWTGGSLHLSLAEGIWVREAARTAFRLM